MNINTYVWARKKEAQGASSGFTLVELLVVIAIIATLLSMLLPAMKPIRQAANRGVCASRMKQYSSAFFLYASDHENYFPYSWGTTYGFTNQLWTAAIDDYLNAKSQKRLQCPANKYTPYGSSGLPGTYSYGALAGDYNMVRHKISRLRAPNQLAHLADGTNNPLWGTPRVNYYFKDIQFIAYEIHGGASVLFADGHVETSLLEGDPAWVDPKTQGL